MSTGIGVPKRVDLNLYDWSSGRLRVSVVDLGGVPVDLSGYTAVLQVREGYGGELLFEQSSGEGIAVGEGYVDVAFDGSVFGPAQWTVGFYDLFLHDTAQNQRYALMTGVITVSASVATF